MKFSYPSPTSARQALTKSAFACAFIALLCGTASAQSRSITSTRPVARLVSVMGGSRALTPVTTRARAINSAASINSYPAARRSATTVAIVAGDEQRVFDLINQARRSQGLPPLALDGELCRIARSHSSDMATQKFINHTNRGGLDAAERARQAGVSGWRALGENIALNQGYDDPAAFAVERWMKSVKHRANITNGMWTHTGLGVARAADGTFYFTQVFVVR